MFTHVQVATSNKNFAECKHRLECVNMCKCTLTHDFGFHVQKFCVHV